MSKLPKNHEELRFLGINSAAKKVGIGEYTLRGLVKSGVIPGFYSGRKFLVDTVRLVEMIENGELK